MNDEMRQTTIREEGGMNGVNVSMFADVEVGLSFLFGKYLIYDFVDIFW